MGTSIYLDNAATTRVHPEVVAAIVNMFEHEYGNPSSLHSKGLEAEAAVRRAREEIARALGAAPDEIVFTSGGTEANNLALFGATARFRRQGGEVLYSAVEHPSVLEAVKELAPDLQPVEIPVTREGVIDLDALERRVGPSTRLLTLMAVNNETGAIQPVAEAIQLLRQANPDALVHVDAVQAFGRIPVTPHTWGVDLLSVSGHKLHGPKGVGALFVRKGVHLRPIFYGGGQERGIRSGTENVPAIVGFGKAVEIAMASLDEANERMRQLKLLFAQGIRERLAGAVWNGPPPEESAPHIGNFSVPGLKGEVLVRALSERGVHLSTGSACSSRRRGASHVLTAMGVDRTALDGSLRVSLSYETTEDEIRQALDIIVDTVESFRSLLGLRTPRTN